MIKTLQDLLDSRECSDEAEDNCDTWRAILVNTDEIDEETRESISKEIDEIDDFVTMLAKVRELFAGEYP